LTNTGPLTGFTREKSICGTSSALELSPSCSSDASRACNSMTSPESTSSAGSIELSQTALWASWRSW
jgi:hypothetical protein